MAKLKKSNPRPARLSQQQDLGAQHILVQQGLLVFGSICMHVTSLHYNFAECFAVNLVRWVFDPIENQKRPFVGTFMRHPYCSVSFAVQRIEGRWSSMIHDLPCTCRSCLTDQWLVMEYHWLEDSTEVLTEVLQKLQDLHNVVWHRLVWDQG